MITPSKRKPNVVFIYADDLGMGMLGCYGQTQFKTPNIDRLAREGLRFDRAYGAAICAPARASLLSGIHDAHAGRWTFTKGGLYCELGENEEGLSELMESLNNTGIQARAGDCFLANMARDAGYVTGEIGKLEWGFATTAEEMRRHGWDYHYGYYDHQMCHGFYPPFMFENGQVVRIAGNTRRDCGKGPANPLFTDDLRHDMSGRAAYSQDIFDRKIVEFIHRHKDEPFFLFHPSQLPHGPTFFENIYPEIAANPKLNRIEKEYASMVVRLDQTVGIILDELERLSLLENTIVIFGADNGHEPGYYNFPERQNTGMTFAGAKVNNINLPFRTEYCGDVFNGNSGLAGIKTTNWEGGTRVPLIVKWPGVVKEGGVTGHLVANYDLMGLFADVAGLRIPEDKDCISYLPVLKGNEDAPQHEHVVYASFFGPGLVTKDGWKLRTYLRLDKCLDFVSFGAPFGTYNEKTGILYQFYNLKEDPQEKNDVAREHPELVDRLISTLLRECDGNFAHGTPNAHFAFTNFRGPNYSQAYR